MPDFTPETLTRLSDPELWEHAKWSATTFRWHPTSAQPPVMGIVFDNTEAGRTIFKEWQKFVGGCEDRFEEIRVCIIDGTNPPGYFVHLSPDPDNVTARATTQDFVMPPNLVWLSRINWMRRVPGSEDLLAPFKREFEKHREFLLAPVTRRSDGQLRFDLMLGVIKKKIVFRQLAEIHEGGFDALILQTKPFISPSEPHPPML